MARIAGVDIPNEKRVEIGLTYIYGIGRVRSNKILAATGINPDTRVKDLTEGDIANIRKYIESNFTVEGEFKSNLVILWTLAENPGLNNASASFLNSEALSYEVIKTKDFFHCGIFLVIVYLPLCHIKHENIGF